jgi:alkanesulfonate monooxygenase SsuD/methylene tetrahydromethanopterin reductase-like flavin-dependent oxidoreductase (luciferase family)
VVPDPVEVGIYLPQVGFTYDALLERAQWVEELGFDSLWLFDHLFFEGSPVPIFEGWTLAAALLQATSRIRVGHLVTCNNFRHPVLVAKMASTLDAISGGRFVLGMGSGSVAHEHEVTGLPWGGFGQRTTRLEESLDIITRLLAGETVTHTGTHYTVDGVTCSPVPERPIPLVLGGGGDRTLDLVARYADWWNCPTYSLHDLPGRIDALRNACVRNGRDLSTIRLTTESVLALAATEDELPGVQALAEKRFGGAAWGLNASSHIGTPTIVISRLRAAMDAGVRTFVFFMHDRVSRSTLELLSETVLSTIRA